MIFFSSSVCGKCKSAIENGPKNPAKDNGQDTLELEDIEHFIEDCQQARSYLETFNSNPDYTSADSVFMLPSANEKLVPQPTKEMDNLRQHIRTEAEKAHALGSPAQDPAKRGGTEPPANRLSSACTMCRGQCCFTGLASKAFLEAESLRAPLFEHPDMSVQDIANFYLDFLPAEHVAESCLYHSVKGCALPRWARADLCGSYLCETVQSFLESSEDLCGNHVHLVVAKTDRGPTEAVLHNEMTPVPAELLSDNTDV